MPDNNEVRIDQNFITPRINELLTRCEYPLFRLDPEGSCLGFTAEYLRKGFYGKKNLQDVNAFIATIKKFAGYTDEKLLNLSANSESFNNIFTLSKNVGNLQDPKGRLGIPTHQNDIKFSIDMVKSQAVPVYQEFSISFFFTDQELITVLESIFANIADQRAMLLFIGLDQDDKDPNKAGDHAVGSIYENFTASYYDSNYKGDHGEDKKSLDPTQLVAELRSSFRTIDDLLPLSIQILADRPEKNQPYYISAIDIVKFLTPGRVNAKHTETGRTLLRHAIGTGSLSDAKNCAELIKRSADPNIADSLGVLPIHMAAGVDSVELIKLFLPKTKGGVDVRDNSGNTPLMAAASSLSLGQAIPLLLQKGAKPNLSNNLGKTALHYAAAFNNYVGACFLLENGADINARDHNGITPLMDAVLNGHWSIVELLLEKGADPNVISKGGNTALTMALFKKQDQIVEKMLDHGVTCIGHTNGCVLNNILQIKDIEKNIDLDFKDKSNNSLLMLEIFQGHITAALSLLHKRAKVNESNSSGFTALHYAVAQKNILLLKTLLQLGADLNLQDNNGVTPLMLAAFMGGLELFKIIYEGSQSSVNLALYDCNNRTVLDYANAQGSADICEYIMEHFDFAASDWQSATKRPLSLFFGTEKQLSKDVQSNNKKQKVAHDDCRPMRHHSI